MNILFLSLLDYTSLKTHDIYADLLRQYIGQGHTVYIVSPIEHKTNCQNHLIIQEKQVFILKVNTGKIQKNNIIRKGINTVLLEKRFLSAIKKYWANVKFDLVLYPTPPITLAGVVRYIKKRDGAKTYLMLKDIFPQNAVDIGMLSKTGLKGFIYRYFRRKEKQLYRISDYIGCMSPANVAYVLKHNPEISAGKVGLCPNAIEVQTPAALSLSERNTLRQKYGLPTGKKLFVYGGNLGKPQGIPFLIECLKTQAKNPNVFFLIVGDGTEYAKLEHYMQTDNPAHVKLLKRLPKEDFDHMLAACDVGMLCLDYRFTIPNFPSRLLAYMQAKLPILALTDPNTDVGQVIVQNGFGWWCPSNDTARFVELMAKIEQAPLTQMGEKAYQYLVDNYQVKNVCNSILRSIQ